MKNEKLGQTEKGRPEASNNNGWRWSERGKEAPECVVVTWACRGPGGAVASLVLGMWSARQYQGMHVATAVADTSEPEV